MKITWSMFRIPADGTTPSALTPEPARAGAGRPAEAAASTVESTTMGTPKRREAFIGDRMVSVAKARITRLRQLFPAISYDGARRPSSGRRIGGEPA